MTTPQPDNRNPEIILRVQQLSSVFDTRNGIVRAVDGVSFELIRGETFGLVGESGCGKTVTALSIMRLLRAPGRISGGALLYKGQDLLALPEERMRTVRGNRIAMIFQEPMTSLNPVFTIGSQLFEVFTYHCKLSKREARERSYALLEDVGIPAPPLVCDSYPHHLSGGMRQRVVIAMGLACNPDVLIADEPTTAIDVTVQLQIMELLDELKARHGMAVLLISHDLGIVAQSCDRIAIMYASHIVETAPTDDMFHNPRHPYTIGLLESIPASQKRKESLRTIPGQVPRPTNYPPGCNFFSRCRYASERCTLHEPELEAVSPTHLSACWNKERLPR
jgi:peptide/nickel transport system ATP-binding protein